MGLGDNILLIVQGAYLTTTYLLIGLGDTSVSGRVLFVFSSSGLLQDFVGPVVEASGSGLPGHTVGAPFCDSQGLAGTTPVHISSSESFLLAVDVMFRLVSSGFRGKHGLKLQASTPSLQSHVEDIFVSVSRRTVRTRTS